MTIRELKSKSSRGRPPIFQKTLKTTVWNTQWFSLLIHDPKKETTWTAKLYRPLYDPETEWNRYVCSHRVRTRSLQALRIRRTAKYLSGGPIRLYKIPLGSATSCPLHLLVRGQPAKILGLVNILRKHRDRLRSLTYLEQ